MRKTPTIRRSTAWRSTAIDTNATKEKDSSLPPRRSLDGKNLSRWISMTVLACSVAVTLFVLHFQDSSFGEEGLQKAHKPIVHTYFEPLTHWSLQYDDSKRSILRAWETAWQARGWSTRVLSQKDAKKHKHFLFVKTALRNLRVDDLNLQCFYRWLAMAATSSGGWLADYDTLPLTLTPDEGHHWMKQSSGTFTAFSNHIPSLIYANASEWNRVLQELFRLLPDPNDDNEEDYYLSDLQLLMNLTTAKQTIHSQSIVWEYPYPKHPDGSLALDCDTLNRKSAIHLSPHFVAQTWQHLPFGKTRVATEADALLFRGEAASHLMEHYETMCL